MFKTIKISEDDKVASNYTLPSNLEDGAYTLTTVKVKESKTSKRQVVHASYTDAKGALRMTIILFSMLVEGAQADDKILATGHATMQGSDLMWVIRPTYTLTKVGDKIKFS